MEEDERGPVFDWGGGGKSPTRPESVELNQKNLVMAITRQPVREKGK